MSTLQNSVLPHSNCKNSLIPPKKDHKQLKFWSNKKLFMNKAQYHLCTTFETQKQPTKEPTKIKGKRKQKIKQTRLGCFCVTVILSSGRG